MAESTPERTVGQLLEQLRAKNPQAASEIFQRFARRLVGMARLRLDEKMRQKVDAEDVVQSVFRSFFARVADGQFDFDNWDSMWGLLVRLTIWKCGRRVEYFRARRRDVGREMAGGTPEDDSSGCEALADDPTPAEAAILADTTELVMRRLNSDKKRRIFELSLQGYSVHEISNMVQHYERGVERVRREIKDILRDMLLNNGDN